MKTGIDPLAIGTEVRLARMGRENSETKARRYLTEGRLWIRAAGPQGVQAFCRGRGDLYRIEYQGAANWICTCPARGRCAHIIAVELVTTPFTTGGS